MNSKEKLRNKKATDYASYILRPVLTDNTLKISRQLLYFSFLTIMLGAGLLVPTDKDFMSLKFPPEMFDYVILVAGICCAFLLLQTILHTTMDIKKWRLENTSALLVKESLLQQIEILKIAEEKIGEKLSAEASKTLAIPEERLVDEFPAAQNRLNEIIEDLKRLNLAKQSMSETIKGPVHMIRIFRIVEILIPILMGLAAVVLAIAKSLS